MSDKDSGSQNGSSECSNDSLNGSWVKLDETFRCGNERPFSIHNGEMENLLAEAADDKISTDRSQERSLCSTPSEERTTLNDIEAQQKLDSTRLPNKNACDQNWIENWASRVEPHPPKKWRLTYPYKKQNHKSTKVSMVKRERKAFHVDIYIFLPTVLLTHILALGIG
ncbi:BCL2/adenovirus E1B 19 kDa protein-interacting protein 3-like isoform X2 [Xenia sp. Carnegie-2017]|nr:BCL2/adenovirus E1B 19 kDa protein-interacting protein 3-like isoform X2 [Xenia sp. Carnegie-2017]